MKTEQWGFSYGKFREYDAEDYYETHYKIPSKLKKMRNYSNGVHGIYRQISIGTNMRNKTKTSKFIIVTTFNRLTKNIKNTKHFLDSAPYDWKFEETQEKLDSDIARRQSLLDEYPEYFV